MNFIFDGSYEGLLTAVFEWFERKPSSVTLVSLERHQPDAFNEALWISNNRDKAERVWKGLENRLDKSWLRQIYCCYLSELPDAFTAIFNFCCYIFQQKGAEQNYGHPAVLQVAQLAKKVEREKHRMEAFIRFERAADGLFYCAIEPDFNVLPLIISHFVNRYTDQHWIIYDSKRNYGIYYDQQTTAEVVFEQGLKGSAYKNGTALDEKEELYANLWKDYFKSTNIQSRKNTKLHVKHVPKRYWKYLTEKKFE